MDSKIIISATILSDEEYDILINGKKVGTIKKTNSNTDRVSKFIPINASDLKGELN